MKKIRRDFLKKISSDLKIVPICALLGPRQCGKTTIAKQFAKQYKGKVHYFDLEDYTDLASLSNPKLLLETLEGLVIIDEIQRRPDLFPYLRVVVDKQNLKFLILGSASRELIKQSSETLAGRITYINVTPFSLSEVDDQKKLWNRGGFPRSYLSPSDKASVRWRETYMQTYFEKDLADLGMNLAPHRILKLWSMLAQYHGNLVNYSNMSQFLETSTASLKNYLDLLEGTFMIRTLYPWHENGTKRLVKTPKIYIRDSGLLHRLININSYEDLMQDIRKGSSWEGFALEEVIKALDLRSENCYFWATHQMAEIDLFIKYEKKRIGFEFKCTDQPKVTKSMLEAMRSLSLDHIFVITPVEKTFPLHEKITVIALKDTQKALAKITKKS